jgi:hypothetical protein
VGVFEQTISLADWRADGFNDYGLGQCFSDKNGLRIAYCV